MYNLLPHQKETAVKVANLLKDKKLAYIFGPPRVGKSLTALESVKQAGCNRIIVLTKKAAIDGWMQYRDDFDFIITNYERINKFNPKDFDCVIIDEAHNFGAYPKPTQRIRDTREFCKGKMCLLLSGTPLVEGALRAYSQFSLSSYSPFKEFKNGYDFFKFFGIPNRIWISGREVETYTEGKTEMILCVLEPYIVRMDYKDAGFNYQNEDFVQLIDTDKKFAEISHKAIKDRMAGDLPLENISKLCQFLHRLSGGLYEKLDNLPKPKIEWLEKFIQEHPKQKIALMCYFQQEQHHFIKKYAENDYITVLSSTKYCEGVDLSDYDHLILYSFGYYGAKFVQLRDRIVNLNKDKATRVILPLLKNGVDREVYKKVKSKQNFNTKTIEKTLQGVYD